MGKLFLHGRSMDKRNSKNYAKLTVNCPSGVIVHVSSDQTLKSFEKKSNDGTVVFDRLTEGFWDVTFTNVDNAEPQSIEITTLDNEISMAYFSATINITYPAGSTCIVTDGSHIYNAPDTSGSWVCSVKDPGTYDVIISRVHEMIGEQSISDSVTITEKDQIESVSLKYFEAYISVSYPTGSECTITDGSNSYTAPDTTGNYMFSIPSTGSYTVTSTLTHYWGTQSDSDVVEITADEQEISVELKYFEAIADITYPAGSACTITDGVTTINAPDTSGSWSCMIPNTGTWVVSITDGEQNRSNSIVITSDGQSISLTIAFFAATISISYPAGSTCTATDGARTLSAPDTSGTWECVVPNTGTWTITITDGDKSVSKSVVITAEGQSETLSISYFSATINVTYPAGSTCTATDGVTTITAPDTSGTWSCVVPSAGTWTVTATDGSRTKSNTVSITADGQIISITLVYTLYLFNRGTWNTISSFKASTSRYISSTLSASAPSIGGTSTLKITSTNNNCDGSAFSNVKVNVSAYSKLKMNITAVAIDKNSNGDSTLIRFGLTTSTADKYDSLALKNMYNGQSTGTISIDVSSINTSAYIFFSLEGYGASRSISFDKIWLE